jgi:hypothetical protein
MSTRKGGDSNDNHTGKRRENTLTHGPEPCNLGTFNQNATESRVRKEVSPGNYEFLFRLDEAERLALNYLAGAIQRAVPDALAPVKPELIAEGKRWLLSRPK